MLDKMTAAELVKKYLAIRDYVTSEQKRFEEHIARYKQDMEAISSQLLDMANTQGCDAFNTEFGTAYKSRIMNVKVEKREELLDFCNEHWDEIGNELLLISAQKDAVKRWLDEEGQTPPGVSVNYFTRINIRRS